MLFYFLRRSLPWQGLTAADQSQKEELALKEKETVNIGDMCENLPGEFVTYFDHVPLALTTSLDTHIYAKLSVVSSYTSLIEA